MTEQPAEQPPGVVGGYGTYPNGGTGDPPPPRSKAGIITAAVVGGALLLGGVGAGIYFLTKGDDPQPAASSSSSRATVPPTQGSSTPQQPSGSANVPPPVSDTTAASVPPPPPPPPTSGGGGSPDDAAISQVAEKYAKAVTAKDEAAAKSATCDNEPGLLYASAEKVEVVGKPEKFGDDSASVPVKISIGASDPIENFPLFMDKKDNGWCISS